MTVEASLKKRTRKIKVSVGESSTGEILRSKRDTDDKSRGPFRGRRRKAVIYTAWGHCNESRWEKERRTKVQRGTLGGGLGSVAHCLVSTRAEREREQRHNLFKAELRRQKWEGCWYEYQVCWYEYKKEEKREKEKLKEEKLKEDGL